MGLERVKPDGGAFAAFGYAGETTGVHPSPSGHRVVQVFTNDLALVHDADGVQTNALDLNSKVVGWTDAHTLLTLWTPAEGPGGLVRFDVESQRIEDLRVPPESTAAGYFAAAMSPRRRWLAVLLHRTMFTNDSVHALALLDGATGAFVADFGITTATDLAWSGDETLVFSADDGMNHLLALTPGDPLAAVPVPDVRTDCSFAGWYTPGRILGGHATGAELCSPVTVDVKTGTTSPASPAFPNLGARPPFALSPDGRDVAVAVGDELLVGPVDGSAFRSLGHARAKIASVGW
jgi:hypothetical protein